MGEIRPLTRQALDGCLNELIEIDRETIGEAWEDRHFRLDLPRKWDHSALLVADGRTAGFVIVSRKPESLHVHRIAVAGASRGRGLGQRLMGHVASRAEREGVSRVTLRVSDRNLQAVGFYDRLGFQRDGLVGDVLDLSVSAAALGAACRQPES